MKSIIKTFCIIVVIIFLFSCQKDEPNPNPSQPATATGTLKVKYHAFVGTDSLIINNNYVNANGDTFNVNMLKYYISNVSLTKNDGSTFIVPSSYYLVGHNYYQENEIVLSGIPEGSYQKINFLIGVDSAANVSGAQAGDLDPAKGMFWNWNTGYIMSRLEGYSPTSTAVGNKIIFHIGGYKGLYNSIRNISINFNGNTALVSPNSSPVLNIKNDISEWFKTPNTISFSSINTIMFSSVASKNIADNYSDAFTFISLQN
jgi:hypothetical protein